MGLDGQDLHGPILPRAPGATSADRVRANAAALRWEPTVEDLEELDAVTG
ncbi:hypothetical protein AB3X52_04505 [Nocardioides sp. DS6]|uniref:Aldo/keto reductase n=1 Tax=Nocardioides eburneus TaxID=3231482 RepID=A0ABV3SXW9_9ACTN